MYSGTQLFLICSGLFFAALMFSLVTNSVFLRFFRTFGIREGQVGTITWAVLGLLVLTLVKGGLTFVEGRWIEQAAQGVAYELRARIQAQLTRLSFAFHAQMSEIHKLNILEKMDQQVEVARMPKEQAPQEVLGKASGGDPAQKPQPVQSSVEKPNLPD